MPNTIFKTPKCEETTIKESRSGGFPIKTPKCEETTTKKSRSGGPPTKKLKTGSGKSKKSTEVGVLAKKSIGGGDSTKKSVKKLPNGSLDFEALDLQFKRATFKEASDSFPSSFIPDNESASDADNDELFGSEQNADEDNEKSLNVQKYCGKFLLCNAVPSDAESIPKDNSKKKQEKLEYEVKNILMYNRKTFHYLIEWAKYELREMTWEYDVTNCKDLLTKFKERKLLCYNIYQNLKDKDQYPGFLERYYNGIITPVFNESIVMEKIVNKWCTKNNLDQIYFENWTREVGTFPNFVTISKNIYTKKALEVLEKCPEFNPKKPFQKTCNIRLMVFKTVKCGWGIRTILAIKQGQYVMEYIGRCRLSEECDVENEDLTYHFVIDTDAEGDPLFVIDATYEGNFSRFINHSCDPNLEVGNVLGYYNHTHFARLVFYAKRDIAPGEEITFSYFSHKLDEEKLKNLDANKYVPECHCGAKKCRKFLI